MSLPSPSTDTTALVTGASSGIGADIARELAQRGHGVVLVARREDRLTTLAGELREQHGVRAEVIGCDLADPAARDGLAAKISALGLRVNVLINNAGYGSAGKFETLSPATETQMVRLNCEAVVALSSAFVPGMIEGGGGAILIVASSAGFQPIPKQATYAATKAFALSFSEALHSELSSYDISVTALCPGPVRTEFMDVAGMNDAAEGTPGFIWVSSEDCAAAGVRGLESGKRVVVPNLTIRASTTASRFTPHAVLLPLMKRFYPV